MGVLDKILGFFAKKPTPTEPVPQPDDSVPAKVKMTPGEFEDYLRQGERTDYATARLEEMEGRLKSISEHPVQKQIIDHEMLASIYNVLKEINQNTADLGAMKARLESVPTMQELYALIQQMKPDLRAGEKRNLDVITGKVSSEIDELYLTFLKARVESTAEEASSELGASRNTVSERMNRLVELGKVKKRRKDRKIYFSLVGEGTAQSQ